MLTWILDAADGLPEAHCGDDGLATEGLLIEQPGRWECGDRRLPLQPPTCVVR